MRKTPLVVGILTAFRRQHFPMDRHCAPVVVPYVLIHRSPAWTLNRHLFRPQ